VFGGRFAYTGALRGTLPLAEAGTLGRFLDLSAHAKRRFVAATTRHAHLRAEPIIGRLPLGLRGDMRLGLALEGGWLGGNSVSDDERARDALTLDLGGETPLGPVYIGVSRPGAGSTNACLVLGVP
jgi:NTE family protein